MCAGRWKKRACRIKPDYRKLQPFGQVPIKDDHGMVLFESGAILLHIGAKSETLLPKDAAARARATQWLIAALNSVEPSLLNLFLIDKVFANEEWAKLRRPGALEFARRRLMGLANSLGEKPYLDGERCPGRAAFKRALDAHMNDFAAAA